MQLTSADKALAAAIAEAHPLEADKPVLRAYHVKVYKPDRTLIGFTEHFESGFAAAQAATERYGLGLRVIVRPAIEQTYIEGLARYPDPLHCDATPSARQGWADESERYERALRYQMAQPGNGKLWGAA
jgi:hypothetical protein